MKQFIRMSVITGILLLSASNISSKNPTPYLQPKLFKSLDSLKTIVEELNKLEDYEQKYEIKNFNPNPV